MAQKESKAPTTPAPPAEPKPTPGDSSPVIEGVSGQGEFMKGLATALNVREGKQAPPEPSAPEEPPVPPPAPAKPAAPPAPTPTPEEPPAPPEDPFTPRRLKSEDWKKVHATIDRQKEEIAQLRSQLESRAPSEEFEKVRQEKEELDQLVRRVAAERHPKNQQAMRQMVDSAVAQARRALAGTDHAAKAERLIKNWEGTEAQLEEFDNIFGDLTPARQSLLREAVAGAERAVALRTQWLEESANNWQREEQEANRVRAEQAKLFAEKTEKAFKKVLEELSDPDEGISLLQPAENAETQKAAAELVRRARHIFSEEADPVVQARNSFNAAIYPILLDSYKVVLEKNAELEETLKKLLAAEPGTKPGVADTGDEPALREGMSGGESLVEAMRRKGLI